MSCDKRKRIDYPLRELVIKASVMLVTLSIGLWCGWQDSYSSFYIATLVQAVNNLYDSSGFLEGYTKTITIFQLIAFVGALVAAILSIIHFTDGGNIVDTQQCVIGITLALSIPILHFVIEIYSMIRQNRY